MTTPHLRQSIGRSPLWRGFILIPLALCCFAFSPRAQALSPPPDGGYPGLNTAEGQNALFSLDTSTGLADTAVGWFSLKSDVNGTFNTAIGAGTLFLNVGDPNTGNGTENTAVGAAALLFNTTGTQNTANGAFALSSNTTGSYNTANGYQSLYSNTTGYLNTATGRFALFSNTTGHRSTATGDAALMNNTTGILNTADGQLALFFNTTGNKNTALGRDAGSNIINGSNNIDIGYPSPCDSPCPTPGPDESNTIRIGDPAVQSATFIAGISGATVTGTAVVINGSGQLGVAPSSARFKEAIKSMDNASEALFSLKPVTFRYKKDIDPDSIPQFGLVAEEVEKVSPDLVARDDQGKVYTVRYDAVNAMLLNEFLKEHSKVEELEANAARQQKQIEALTAGLQKVSAQLEASKPATQVVNNP